MNTFVELASLQGLSTFADDSAPLGDAFALDVIQPPLRSESSVSPAFNIFGDISFPGELPKPVIHRTPEELGIPRVVPDAKPLRMRNISPDPIRQDRTTFARAGAKRDKPRPSALPAATLAPHHQAAVIIAQAIGANEVTVCPAPKPQRTITNERKPMKITEEQKQAIRDSDPSESGRVVGERLGIDGGVVLYYRAKFAKEAKRAKPARKPVAPPMNPRGKGKEERRAEIVMHPSRQVTMLVTDKIVETWWQGLTHEKRAELFAGNYVIRLEGSVA